MAGSIICLYGGARPICWQLQQRWRVVELLPPVGKLAFQNLSLEPVALPDCVIGVLDGKWRQGDRLALNSSAIQNAQLLEKDINRPAIRDDVVLRQEQHMFLLAQTQDAYADQWTSSQIKGSPGLLIAKASDECPALILA